MPAPRLFPALPGRVSMPALAALAAGFFPQTALAGEPFCTVQETCHGTNDNCTPAAGLLTVVVQPSGKAQVNLNDNPPLESTILNMNGMILLIFRDGVDQHQLRIQSDGTFNYLISKPDRSAPKGKAQVLYRGQCQEGQ